MVGPAHSLISTLTLSRLTDIFTSYYGGLTCVTWSPDGQYVLTGGQDDLISIWSFAEKRIVARCQGHESWVTQITFDPWRCDDRNYRFGSVGEDCRVLLWDFNVGMLHRPKASSVRAHRESISSRLTSALHRQETGTSATTRMRADSNLSESALVGSAEKEKETSSIRHPIEPRARVTILPPVLSRIIDVDPVSWVGFTEDAILTSCNKGHIRTWLRPEKEKTPE